jgi:hypothetical protein
MLSYRMRFYVHEDLDGNYHVQNFVGGYLGQHHVHSPASFESWRDGVEIEMLDPAPCDCGLNPGDVREYDGRVWHNDEFDDVWLWDVQLN